MKHTTRNTQHTTRITVEVALWIVVAIIALALRLFHLDAAPLNGREAREAMLAWRAVTGQGMPGTDYNPLLFAANVLLFSLCGTSDAIARLWPALCGSALAVAPLLLRQRIGRMGALAAGLYLALSPTALFASRQLDGAVVAALGGMVFLGGLVRFFDSRISRCLALSAGGLALAVTASPLSYGLLLTLALAWLILSRIWSDGEDWSLITGHWSLLGVFLLVVLTLSTGLGWNLTGLGAAGDLLTDWLARFGPASSPVALPFTLLVIYEPLALLFGLGGLAWAVRCGNRFGVLMGLWAGLGTLLLVLMPGRAPLDVLWAILPLALLAGIAMESLARSLQARGSWLAEGLCGLVVLVLWVYFYLVLARYTESGNPTELALALLVLVLQFILVAIFAFAMRIDTALRGFVVGTGVVLLMITVSVGWGGAHVRPADPREFLACEPTAIEVRDLLQTLRDLSWRETGMPTTLAFTFEASPESVLAWYLRDFSAARRVESLERLDTGESDLVLVTSRRDPVLPEDMEYVGQDFALRRTWNRAEIGCAWQWPPYCNAAVKWLLRRRSPSPPVADQRVVLWLHQNEADRVSE